MSPTDRPPKALVAAMLAPFGIALAALIFEVLAEPAFNLYHGLSCTGLVLLVILPVALAQGRLDGRGIGAHARRLAAVSPCLLAPLSVLYPWTANFGADDSPSQGFAAFLHGLTTHPNRGPISGNEILCTLCALVASSTPVAFAIYHYLARLPRTRVLVILLALDLVAFVPLMIFLDIYSIGVAVDILLAASDPSRDYLSFDDPFQNDFTMLNNPSWSDSLLYASGPLLRLVPVFVMTALVVLSWRRRVPAASPPAGDAPRPDA